MHCLLVHQPKIINVRVWSLIVKESQNDLHLHETVEFTPLILNSIFFLPLFSFRKCLSKSVCVSLIHSSCLTPALPTLLSPSPRYACRWSRLTSRLVWGGADRPQMAVFDPPITSIPTSNYGEDRQEKAGRLRGTKQGDKIKRPR